MTPKELHERLAGDAETVCRTLLPNGKRHGSEWCAGSIGGEAGDSLKVRLNGGKAGIWKDFADAGRGGDMIDLVKAVRGVGLREAMEWARQYLGIRDDSEKFKAHPKRQPPKPVRPLRSVAITAQVEAWFQQRGIGVSTLQRYRVVSQDTTVAFPCYTPDGELMHVKYRDTAKPKKESMRTSTDSTPILFGWQGIDADAREVVITEGEPDALAYAQEGIAALSVPMGAGVGAKQAWIDLDWERLEQFDTLYISTDADEEGKLTAEHLVSRLGQHRCRVVEMPEGCKDANDALLAGHDLGELVRAARYMDPAELRNGADFLDAVRDVFYPKDEKQAGSSLPWKKADDKFRLRPAELTIWTGINGHGKSMVLSQIIAHATAQDERACIASMEMPAPKLLHRMFQQIGAVALPSEQYLVAINEWVRPRIWIVNIHGTAKGERLIELARYAWRRYGVTQFVVDSLAKCGWAEDDYTAQKAFVDRLCDLCHETGLHVHLVVHARKGEDESRAPGKMDVKGTGALTDMVDNVCSVWRNKKKEAAIEKANRDTHGQESETGEAREETLRKLTMKPDAVVEVLKQRNFDFEGRIALWFDRETHQYLSAPDHKPRAMLQDWNAGALESEFGEPSL